MNRKEETKQCTWYHNSAIRKKVWWTMRDGFAVKLLVKNNV